MTIADRGRSGRFRGEVARFLLVGAVGFVVDGAVLLALVEVGGTSRLWARIPSFLVAVTVTWFLHRNFTFAWAAATRPSISEWRRFVFANALGNGVNLSIYTILVTLFDLGALAALAIASVVAAAVNYAMSTRWVFRRR